MSDIPFPHDIEFNFPPVRELVIPDPGYTIVDIDLAGADAQVVAYTANDADLKEAFRRRIKIHVHNGIKIFGVAKMGPDGKAEPYYTRTKKGVHATNYGARDAARRCGMLQTEWVAFQRTWFQLHPPIKEWHERVEFDLQRTRTISNRFGFRITFFDRPENCFNRALAWEPQSTVAEVTYCAMRIISRAFKGDIQMLMQVHDSLVLQIPTRILHSTLSRLYNAISNIIVPFDDPLVIPWGLKVGCDNWGRCADAKWTDYVNDGQAKAALPELGERLQHLHAGH